MMRVVHKQSSDEEVFIELLRLFINVAFDVPTGDPSLQVLLQQEVHSSLQKKRKL